MKTNTQHANSIETFLVADIVPYARNARTHSDEQVAQIAEVAAERLA